MRDLEHAARPAARYVVAFSGGLDSTVLLHALKAFGSDVPIVAVHINHGLQDEAVAWESHCSSVATELGVKYESIDVDVDLQSGKGPEAAARDARYGALLECLDDNDWLLSAHHRDDQAETLLLNLIRGSGPAGVAGMGGIRRFGSGWLARPLLNVERESLHLYAQDSSLRWIEDPSNVDTRFDRNFLRHEIVPRLQSRWPDLSARFQRSAGHAGEAAKLLADLAAIDLDLLEGRAERLPVQGLLKLSDARKRNLIRYCLRQLGLTTPTAQQLRRVLGEVIPARADAQPLVSWPGGAVRRYRNHLYLLQDDLAVALDSQPVVDGTLELGRGLGTLCFTPGAGFGLSEEIFDAGLTVCARQGGENIRLPGQSHTKKLKKLLQEEGVVPWMRDRIPLLYANEQLVAVGDLWIAAGAGVEHGISVLWRDRPALH
ncbi:MAG: tRNA lysidine(34) synthetase TilS [Gammaproteobacteria bacterium]|nr:tRNA lysidine(34) synthetase TilS [Gammaproteobacteria bacterium]